MVSSHFVNFHFVNIDQMGIDQVGIEGSFSVVIKLLNPKEPKAG